MRLTRPLAVTIALFGMAANAAAQGELRDHAINSLRKAATAFVGQAASHGGYVYHYLPDFSRRWGEGEATRDQIWVQPPGTPTVGMALLRAYDATNDDYYLQAATAAAEALVYGQLKSGGWTNCVDFDPHGKRAAAYRNGKGRGKNNSSLDDGQTQSAIRFLVQTDAALTFRNRKIHNAAVVALDALLAAQFPNGAFPQVWTRPVSGKAAPRQASYPDYDWKTEGRIKEYWDEYTLNDNVAGYVVCALAEAHRVYGDDRYLDAIRQLGDFLLLAQLPEPQPGWAQQYNVDMHPIWARKFEPAAVAGDETQEVIETLLIIHSLSGDDRYLKPIPPALAWLRRSRLSDGRIARYYELRTNRPLYMHRRGKLYELTFSDANLPSHYGWKMESRIGELARAYKRATGGGAVTSANQPTDHEVRGICDSLSENGLWLTTFTGERLVGQMKLPVGTKYVSSDSFSRNVTFLSEWLTRNRN